MQNGARALGLTLRPVEVKNADDLARAFAALEKERPDALTMLFDPLASGYRQLVADYAKKHKLPSVFGAKEFAEAGGLISYSPNVARASDVPLPTSTEFSGAPSPAIYPSSNRPSSRWSST